jgi:hypothetical protein
VVLGAKLVNLLGVTHEAGPLLGRRDGGEDAPAKVPLQTAFAESVRTFVANHEVSALRAPPAELVQVLLVPGPFARRVKVLAALADGDGELGVAGGEVAAADVQLLRK